MYNYPGLAAWARTAELSTIQLDCFTTVMLKILDGKCQMNEEQRQAYITIYNVTKVCPGDLLGDEVRQAIDMARQLNRQDIRERIHQLRLEAEALIPKPVMKAFKAEMRDILDTMTEQDMAVDHQASRPAT